jgi:glucose-6-phosphate isomerase
MMTESVTAAGVSVTLRVPAADDLAAVVRDLSAADIPGRLRARDAGIWGRAATAVAARRLGWLDVPGSAAHVPATAQRLAESRSHLDHVVLLGMGGSSLGAEVVAHAAGRELTILDTTDCDETARALAEGIERTLVIVSSKSGETIETESQFRIYRQAFADAGFSAADIAERFVVVTDAGSLLAKTAAAAHYAAFLVDPDVGGRYSALTPFGLVAGALLEVDVARLLDDAVRLGGALRETRDNPGLLLGAALGAAARAGRDKLVVAGRGPQAAAFGDWAEQLLAESSGKNGRGMLPIPEGACPASGDLTEDMSRAVVTVGSPVNELPEDGPAINVSGPLGAQFLLWEYATAVAARVIEVNPFDQPNVEEAKANTMALLRPSEGSAVPSVERRLFADGAVEVFAGLSACDRLRDCGGLRELLDRLLAMIPPDGYLAIMAYLDRGGDAPVIGLRRLLERRTSRPVTFGWGPRYLHSTGQYHKGGPPNGVFCQVTGVVKADIPVPGRPYSLGQIQQAQAAGDLRALCRRDRPVVRIHLHDRRDGTAQLLASLA